MSVDTKPNRTPPWAMRPCKFCREYAQGDCDSWDKEKQDICRAPICRRHMVVVGRTALCPDHDYSGRRHLPPPPTSQNRKTF